MSKNPTTLDWNAIEEEIAEANRKSWDAIDHDALKAKAEAERQRRIKAGWEDEDGNSLLPPDDTDEED